MFLKITVRNNGYGCSCCSREYHYHEWVSELPPFASSLLASHENNAYDGVSAEWYEKDGVVLHGFQFLLYRACASAYVLIDKEAHPVGNNVCGCSRAGPLHHWKTDEQLTKLCAAHVERSSHGKPGN